MLAEFFNISSGRNQRWDSWINWDKQSAEQWVGRRHRTLCCRLLRACWGRIAAWGGLAGLVQAFQKNGLGDIVNSWVSTGKNLPVTPDQIKQGLGSDFLNQLASKAGISPDAASTQLSSLLPDVINKVTPNGKIEAGGVDQMLKMFQGKMGA